MMFALLAAVAAAIAQPLPAPPIDPAEIVVTGRRGGTQAQPDAVDYLRSFCFDPARRTGRLAPPDESGRWYPLDDRARRQFRIDKADVPAFSRADGVREHELWLKLERFSRDGLVEQRCTMLVIGGRDHERFVAAMSRLFKGVPTQRHVGHADGSPPVPGWKQWLWTGMPQRGSSAWRAIQQPRGAQTSWVVVSDPGFYREHDYIVGDMKLRPGPGTPLTLLQFAVVRKRP